MPHAGVCVCHMFGGIRCVFDSIANTDVVHALTRAALRLNGSRCARQNRRAN